MISYLAAFCLYEAFYMSAVSYLSCLPIAHICIKEYKKEAVATCVLREFATDYRQE